MIKNDQEYWMQLLDKLNEAEDIDHILKAVLEDICKFFQFGVGYVYEADYRGDFHLAQTYQAYKIELPGLIEHDAFMDESGEGSLFVEKLIYFREGMAKSPIGEILSKLLNAKSIVMAPVYDQGGNTIALIGILDRRGKVRHDEKDIAFTGSVFTTLGTFIKMRLYQNRIQNTEKALASMLDHMGVDVYVNDYETHEILYVNKSMAEPYGGVDKMIGRICWQELYSDKSGECDFCPKPRLIDEQGNPTKGYGWDYKRPFDGSWFRVLSAAFPWVDGRLAQVISSVDITDNKTNEEIIRRAAEYDLLTSLPNRSRITPDIERRIKLIEDSAGGEGYVLFFDLDGFKAVNDTKGHPVGDELLAAVGAFLQENELTRNRSYRYGGDEFVVLWDTLYPGTIDEVITCMLDRFAKDWHLENCTVRCGASIGISRYPTDGNLASVLVRGADQAMYESKSVGTGAVHYYNKGKPILSKAYPPGEKRSSR